MAAFTVIEHVPVGAGGAAAVVLDDGGSSIPVDGTYDHLLILASFRYTASTYAGENRLTFNGISTSTEYSGTWISSYETGGTNYVVSSRETSGAGVRAGNGVGVDQTANIYSVSKIWIPHFANSANFKQVLTQNAMASDDNTTDYYWGVASFAGLWANTAAITSCTMTGSSNYTETSTFTLYGVKGA